MNIVDESRFAADPRAVLRAARSDSEVVISCDDGSEFAVTLRRPASSEPAARSPLDVGAVPGLRWTDEEIVAFVREGRERVPEWLQEMLDARSGGDGDEPSTPPNPARP